jgi:hypothetical protein
MTDFEKAAKRVKSLGMDQSISRRDFLNSTLIGSGALLLGSLSPAQLMRRLQQFERQHPGGTRGRTPHTRRGI